MTQEGRSPILCSLEPMDPARLIATRKKRNYSPRPDVTLRGLDQKRTTRPWPSARKLQSQKKKLHLTTQTVNKILPIYVA